MSLQSEIETLRKDKIALESQLRQLGHQPADDLPKKRTEPAVSSNAVLPKDDPVDLGTEFKSDLLNIMGSFGF
nr:hypothetical protein HK105_008223 [Polyrhizophydium stewartii]